MRASRAATFSLCILGRLITLGTMVYAGRGWQPEGAACESSETATVNGLCRLAVGGLFWRSSSG